MIIEAELEITDQTVEDALETVQIASDGGYEKGYEAGLEQGKQAVMDVVTHDGERTNFDYVFNRWSDYIPVNRAVKVKRATSFFNDGLLTRFDDDNWDFSQCTIFQSTFQSCRNLTYVMPIDVSSAGTLSIMFMNSPMLETVTLLNIPENCVLTSMFIGCTALTNLTVTGTIGDTFNTSHCGKLSIESAKSVSLALKDFTGTGQEYSKTVQFSGNTWALLDADGATAPGGLTWREYVTQVKCWNT